jgi:hypothetical protein
MNFPCVHFALLVSTPHPVFGAAKVVKKPGKGAFFATQLDALLRERQVTHLAIAGVTTEVCVQTTMREANDRGYECLLVEDATESYFPESRPRPSTWCAPRGPLSAGRRPSTRSSRRSKNRDGPAYASAVSSPLASFRSAVSKPSVNQS